MDTHATITGTITADPTLRFTGSGTAVVGFSLAVNSRKKENGEWVDGPTSFFDVTCWKGLAENVAESFSKGDRLIVTGRLEQQSWEKDGQTRTKVQLVADEVGASVRWATVEVQRTSRRSEGEAAAKVQEAFDASTEPF